MLVSNLNKFPNLKRKCIKKEQLKQKSYLLIKKKIKRNRKKNWKKLVKKKKKNMKTTVTLPTMKVIPLVRNLLNRVKKNRHLLSMMFKI